jgi:hypothetical protein
MADLDPFSHARRDAEGYLTRAWHRVADFGKVHVTAALLKTLGLTGVAGVAAALVFPIFAFVVVAAAFVALSVYAVYMTKIVKAQDRDERWTYVAGKRVQQDALDAKIAMDSATLALMGERHAPGMMRGASAELKSALTYHQHRLRLAEERANAVEAVRDGTGTDEQRRNLDSLQRRDQRRPTSPKGPAIEPIKARRAALTAARAELEAEIKSLATADDIDKAMKTEEVEGARRTRREREEAAREADQSARDRVRAGKEPTGREPEHVINLRISPNGDRNVATSRGAATPEQIAKGDGLDRGENVA